MFSVSSGKRPKIVVCDGSVILSKLYEIGNVLQYDKPTPMPREELLKEVEDANALYCFLRNRIDKELLDRAKNLQIVSTMSVGYEHIDIAECKKRGIRVGHTPGVLTETTAELAVALLLATCRRIPEALDIAKKGGFVWTPYYLCGRSLADTTVGIYGLGAIGRSIAEKCAAFHPSRIIYHNRKRADNVPYEYVTFDELLAQSDFLIVSVSVSPENIRIFNRQAFARMKRDATFINISRGVVVNHDDLYEALKTGEIGSAGLDVTDPEPLPVDSPLFTLNNCVIFPHIGSASMKTRQQMVAMAEENIYNFYVDKPLVAEVNL